MEYVKFAEKHIPEGQFHWFIYIISYLHFVTGETVSTVKSKGMRYMRIRCGERRSRQSSFPLSKTNMTRILGELSERKE